MTDLYIINLLDIAVQLAGDGGLSPFTSEEYKSMYNFLNRLRNQYKDENA